MSGAKLGQAIGRGIIQQLIQPRWALARVVPHAGQEGNGGVGVLAIRCSS